MVKKISHKEVRRRMKMNEMEEAQHWLERLWEQHSQKITWGLVGIAVLAVVVYLYSDSRKKGQFQAQTLLSEALATVSEEKYDEALPLVDQILQQYTSSPTFPLALLLRGDILSAQDDLEAALESYQQLIGRRGEQELVPAALLSIAACQEGLDRQDEAESTYRRLLDEFPQATEGQEARFLLAQLLERQGKDEGAVDLYRAIPDESVWSSEARQRADWLAASPITLSTAAASASSISSTTPS